MDANARWKAAIDTARNSLKVDDHDAVFEIEVRRALREHGVRPTRHMMAMTAEYVRAALDLPVEMMPEAGSSRFGSVRKH